MTRLQVFGREFFRFLRDKGYQLERIKGSHHVFHNAQTAKTLVVPVHSGSDLKKGMLAGLLAAMGCTAEDFIRWRNS